MGGIFARIRLAVKADEKWAGEGGAEGRRAARGEGLGQREEEEEGESGEHE